MNWTPIAEELREDVQSCIASIAKRLQEYRLARDASPWEYAETALFFGYLARSREDSTHEKTCASYLALAQEALTTQPMMPELYDGFVGVAWIFQHLENLFNSEADDLFGSVDQACETLVHENSMFWQGPYDLISGWVGLGVYLCNRLPGNPRFRPLLEGLVSRFDKTAEILSKGVAWLSRPEFCSREMARRHPEGCYNLGVAHGVPGVIVLLARLYSKEVLKSVARRLLEGSISWLLSQKGSSRKPSLFSSQLGADGNISGDATRVGWCYGDLGIATALLVAARLADEPRWEEEAIRIARHTAERTAESTLDAGLCHGAAGATHLFNRLYQATGEGAFREAALHWLGKTLEFRDPEDAFLHRTDKAWVFEPGFLTGIAGIGLALLGTISSLEPAWDQLLLADVPQRG